MKDYFGVGELASLFDLNVQTIRYYDAIGLFQPKRKEGLKGERIYQFDQIYELAMIRFLKKLGYPLDRIRQSLEARAPGPSIEEMRLQSAELGRRCEELDRTRRAIDRKVRFLERKLEGLDPEAMGRARFPVRKYLRIGLEENLYKNEAFYYYPTVVFYDADGKSFGAMLIEELAGEAAPAGALAIPAGEYLFGYHKGPYEAIESSFARIRAEGDRLGLALSRRSVNVNIIDQFVERNPRNYITEIQFAVEPTAGAPEGSKKRR